MPQRLEKEFANNYTVTEILACRNVREEFFQAKTLIAKLFNVMH